MKIGLHLSIAGGLPKSLHRAQALECQALQIFLQNPRSWKWREVSDPEVAEFRRQRGALVLDPVVAHLAYLPNLGAADTQLYDRSWERLRLELRLGQSLGLDYLICHPGHAADTEAGWSRLAAGLYRTVTELPPPPLVLLENTAGQKNELGQSIAALQALISRSAVPLGFCLDTAHAFAAGYNLRSAAGRRRLRQEILSGPGPSALRIIHLNDSRFPCGSRRDRHWHLGQGAIGLTGLARFLRDCAFGAAGVILETPIQEPGDDRRNLAAARKILLRAAQENSSIETPSS